VHRTPTDRPQKRPKVKGTLAMLTAKTTTNDPFILADACGDHTAELANIRVQQEVLKCVSAAQNRLMTIRGEFADLYSLVYRIGELRPDHTPSRSQKNLVDDLLRQQLSVDDLATSLTCLLD
jgi:hypothetical protein